VSDEWEKKGEDLIYGRSKGFGPNLLRSILHGFSYLFKAVVKTRLHLFKSHWKKQAYLGTHTVSIGNITMGGTGKTPVTELLARTLNEKGRKVAILSRGYKSSSLHEAQKWKRRSTEEFEALPKIVSDGQDIFLHAKYAGDEPLMLAKNLPGVSVIVDKDRVNGGKFAISELEADTLILDDGLQYLHIEHQTDIILVDHDQPFGTGHLIPRGTLREPPENLSRAHFIFITKCKQRADPELIKEIRSHNPSAGLIECAHHPTTLQNLDTGEQLPLETLKGKHIAALSGIAVPANFERLLTSLGATVEFHRTFSDHHNFKQKEIDTFMERCLMRSIDMILTTEKDAVRFLAPTDPHTPIHFLRIEIKILHGRSAWNDLVTRITKLPLNED